MEYANKFVRAYVTKEEYGGIHEEKERTEETELYREVRRDEAGQEGYSRTTHTPQSGIQKN